MAMSINNLKIFVEVVNNGNNITFTAQKLYVSQPSISKAIKNIEEELNVSLFYRDKSKGLQLTPIGEKILLSVRELLHEEQKIYQYAYEENKLLNGTLRIASIPLNTYPFIARAIKEFKQLYPNVKLEYFEGTTNQVKDRVFHYESDLGITVYPFDNFEKETLYDDDMVAFSKKDLGIDCFDFRTIKDKVMVCQSGLEVIEPVLEKERLFNINQFISYSTPSTVRVFVDEGLGIGIVSKSFIDNKDYYIYPIYPSISSEAGIIYNKQEELSSAAREFIKILETKTRG